jgi:hypothetical protein
MKHDNISAVMTRMRQVGSKATFVVRRGSNKDTPHHGSLQYEVALSRAPFSRVKAEQVCVYVCVGVCV